MPSSRVTVSSSRGPSTPSRPTRTKTAPGSASKVNGVAKEEDIQIDPALLDETGGPVIVDEDAEGEVEEDAEGEYEEDEVMGDQGGVEEPYINYEELQYDQLASQSSRPNSRSQRIPRASSSQAVNYADYPPMDDTPVPRRGRPPKNASLPTSRSAPRLNDLATPLGKGKGKAVATGAKAPGKHGKVGVDMNCSFCLGTNEVNRLGKPELMLSCARCGRSGHPTCLNIISKRLLKTVREYEWCCIECKTCEICEIKGDDNRLMFCDGCDRGWHSYCLDPPLVKPPKGQWLCPKCNSSGYNHSGPSIPSSRSAPNLSYKGKVRTDHTSLSHSTPAGRHKHPHPPLDPLINGAGPKVKPKPHIATGRPRGRPRRDATLETGDARKGNMKIRLRIPSGRRTVEVESEDEKVPYGGVITGHDADTSQTGIKESDKAAFEKSRLAAEAKLGGPVDITPGSPAPSNGSYFPSLGSKNGNGINGHTPSKSTPLANRSLRDRILQQSFPSVPASPGETPTPGTPINLPNLSGSQKIRMVRFGVFEIDTWFSAPYPEEYQSVPDGRLWICEFCFKYMKSGFVAERHRVKCKARHPPGDEIYRDDAVSVFEVDGRKNKIYCQNLCLFAKMFLDSKTLYYDVEPFLFYVMTEVDDMGARSVGYFSKEKRSLDNNVSCIMTLPVRQRKGWGQLLIDFSYLLSKKEERVGGPERPLSGLGEVTYKKYWSLSVMRYLQDCTIKPTLEDISADTSMTLEDVFLTLKYENMITVYDTPPRETPAPPPTYPRQRGRSRRGGRSLTNRRQPRNDSSTPAESEEKDKVIIPERYEIVWDAEYIEAVLRKSESRGFLTLRPERLKYHPFLVSRTVQKPPGALARATLMANNPNARRASRTMPNGVPNGHTRGLGDKEDSETPMETPEKVLSGEDQATLDLVARLSGGSRNLRHRTTSVTFDADEPASKRLRKNRSSTSLRRMASNDEDEDEDEFQDAEDGEEDEDDPLRLGKGMNGTPRRSKRVRPRSPVPVRSTRSHDKIRANGSVNGTGVNGLPNGDHGKHLDADGDIIMEGSEIREETEEVEEPVEDVDYAEGDEDAEGEEEEEWVE